MGKRKPKKSEPKKSKPPKLRRPTAVQIRKALAGSIAKWEKIVKACKKPHQSLKQLCEQLQELEKGTENCPLCLLFGHTTAPTKLHLGYLDNPEAQVYPEFGSCRLCPVYAKSGSSHCYDTPYTGFDLAVNDIRYRLASGWTTLSEAYYVDELLRHAAAELAYLKKLLDGWDKKHPTGKRTSKPS